MDECENMASNWSDVVLDISSAVLFKISTLCIIWQYKQNRYRCGQSLQIPHSGLKHVAHKAQLNAKIAERKKKV